ncbi:MAG: Gfo/Idh/MocA family oxidoreductase [Alphaproteobacteria bacterium]|nr:Gfo/Idh/MocA family oxidoreductase [Alphaproteobacteria bacterium]
MNNIKIGFWGTKHAHASDKMQMLRQINSIEIAGVYEPDNKQRQRLQEQNPNFQGLNFYNHAEDMLSDINIIATASEGLSCESLNHTEAIIRAGKHCWYDKPAGDNFHQFQKIIALAQKLNLHLQMSYMFRFHNGFNKIAEWVHSGFLGTIFSIRANMSVFLPAERGTSLNYNTRDTIAWHRGGILYDLGCHMIDQICWLLGRPQKVTSFLRNDSKIISECHDNTLGVLEFSNAMAIIDIAAMVVSHKQTRRFEVYGSKGSAILIEPYETTSCMHLYLNETIGGYHKGLNIVPLSIQTRADLYKLDFESFIATICNQAPPIRSPEHELLVQETLLKLA